MIVRKRMKTKKIVQRETVSPELASQCVAPPPPVFGKLQLKELG